MKNEIIENETIRKRFAKAIALNCFRNTKLEDLHAGIAPSTKIGDYSDVKVVTPHGEIPWKNLSRFNDEEMKELMIDVVDSVYTFFTNLTNPKFSEAMEKLLKDHDIESGWNEPKLKYPEIVRMPGNYDTGVDELDEREPRINEMRHIIKKHGAKTN